MSLIAAVRSGAGGRVMAFEPNPHVATWLRKNIDHARAQYEWRRSNCMRQPWVRLRANVVQVDVETVDQLIGVRSVGVLKIDVEGHEQQALEGASQALRTHRIRHVVFEDHHGAGSKAMSLLRAAGYEILSIGWSMRGPIVAPAVHGSLATVFEAPSYLATIDARAARDACAQAGWWALQRQTREVGETFSQ